MPEHAQTAARKGMLFEQYRVGQRLISPTRTVTEEDLERFTEISGDQSAIHVDAEYARSVGFPDRIVHGPFGVAAIFGLLHQIGIVEQTVIAMLDLDWRFTAPILVGDTLHLEHTVLRCRRSSKPGRGIVRRHMLLANQDGVRVQEGTSTVLVAAREGDREIDAHVRTDFCSQPWAQALAERLQGNDDFAAATRTFDGSIELRCGAEHRQLRIYKGAVLDVASSTPSGPTFTIGGSELSWVELAFAERNEYMPWAMGGQFTAGGNIYEYVRMTKAVVAIWDCIRALAQEAE